MAKIRCICGHVFSTSGEIPNPNQWMLVSDVKFDEFSGDANVDALYLGATIAFRCPHSGHLWVYWDGFDDAPQLYAPMQGGERGQ